MRDDKAARRTRHERRQRGRDRRGRSGEPAPVFDWQGFRASLPGASASMLYDRVLVAERRARRRARHEVVMGLAQRPQGASIEEVADALGCSRRVAVGRLVRLQGQGILERRGTAWHDTGHRPGHAHRRGQPIGGSGGFQGGPA